MAEYLEGSCGDTVFRKFGELNDLLIAVYHIATYGGCEFGCTYCDAWSYSDQPINSKIYSYRDLPGRLPGELKNVEPGEAIGFTLGDPYQPAEKRYRITRRILELLKENGRPVIILTKSPSVREDLELIKEMNADSFAIVATTLVTLDDSLLSRLESRVPAPEERIRTIGTFKKAGIPCGFVLNPVIPYFTDNRQHMFNLLETVAKVSPDFVVWDYLWIPNDRYRKRMVNFLGDSNIIGKLDALYGNNPQPASEYRGNMDRFLIESCRKLGLEPRIPAGIYQKHLHPGKVLQLKERRTVFLADK